MQNASTIIADKTTPQLTTAPVTTAPANPLPEFGNIATAINLFDLSRSFLYEREKAGDIRFVRIRTRGQVKGKTLVDLDSVRRWIARCAEKDIRFASPNPAAKRNASNNELA